MLFMLFQAREYSVVSPLSCKCLTRVRRTHPSLYSAGLITRNFRWLWETRSPEGIDSANGIRARVQFRHRMTDVPCIVKRYEGELAITFAEPQLAVAPGQVAALYDETGNWCLGSGEISRTFHENEDTA